MPKYVCVAPHAITPTDGLVPPGDIVELEPDVAAKYVAVGHLIELPADPKPATKQSTPVPVAVPVEPEEMTL